MLAYDPMDIVLNNDSIPNPFPDESMATGTAVSITKTSIPTAFDTTNFLFRLPITAVSQTALPTPDPNAALKSAILKKIKKLQKKLRLAKKKGKAALAKRLAKKIKKLKKRLSAL